MPSLRRTALVSCGVMALLLGMHNFGRWRIGQHLTESERMYQPWEGWLMTAMSLAALGAGLAVILRAKPAWLLAIVTVSASGWLPAMTYFALERPIGLTWLFGLFNLLPGPWVSLVAGAAYWVGIWMLAFGEHRLLTVPASERRPLFRAT